MSLKTFYNIIYPYFLAKPKDLNKLAGANWAVITGSTDGIGKSFAKELAGHGFNLVLISRTQSRLDDVKKEILEKYPKLEIKTIVFDFTNAKLDDYEELIFEPIKDLNIGILVNNVGMFFEYPDRFEKLPGGTKAIRDLTIVNILPIVILTSRILKNIVPRNKGVIINVSSTSSTHRIKYHSVYSASKKCVTWLTNILSKEFQNTGIIIQCLNPSFVSTKLSRLRPSLLIPSPDEYVKQALKTVGYVDGTTGCWNHEIQCYVGTNESFTIQDCDQSELKPGYKPFCKTTWDDCTEKGVFKPRIAECQNLKLSPRFVVSEIFFRQECHQRKSACVGDPKNLVESTHVNKFCYEDGCNDPHEVCAQL